MKNKFVAFLKDEEGATAIEYGLIAGLIAAVIAGTLGILGGQLDTLFSKIKTALSDVAPPPAE
ncbi:Flp family type IVb pilin [Pusillimonas noertemannii]|uniref:Flp family type IVb pilin n=1 Tax=Pusillimonas noertemannii TaxID=305977 RepID=UPI00036DE43B|nr:Flp family type IVb pilin [Pusillimonas noertemannii]